MSTLIALILPFAFAPAYSNDFTVAPAIQEVSGAVWDDSRQVVWSIGDGGNGAKLGVTSMKDWSTQAIEVTGAENVDWEAITPSVSGELWILDIGDNAKARPFVSAYAIDPDEAALGLPRSHRKIEWSYPSGPMDVEGAVAHGNEIFLFEKIKFGIIRIHAIDISAGASPIQVARLHSKISPIGAVGMITDATFDPAGRLYLMTYLGIYSCEGCLNGRAPVSLKMGFWGQVETLIAFGNGRFLIAAEDGRFRKP